MSFEKGEIISVIEFDEPEEQVIELNDLDFKKNSIISSLLMIKTLLSIDVNFTNTYFVLCFFLFSAVNLYKFL